VRAGEVIVGRYRLDERIGSGGMGTVWRATDRELDRVVAMKRPHEAGNGRLRYEAKIAAGLQHPNIVTVYDVINDGDDRWLVMEYVPSRSLAEILADKHTLPPAQVAHLGAQIAGALAAVHAKGVVHGDVKPGNVLVTEGGIAKLTDFGVSRTVWGEVTLTGTGPVVGTPAYLAPEVADGERPTAASDVYSLGATLFAAVEGNLPTGLFAADKPFQQAGPLAPPIATMLTRQPAARPTAELAERLLRETVADRTTPPPAIPRSHKPSRRTLVIGAAAIVVVGSVVGFLVTRPSTTAGTGKTAVIGDPRTADPCGLMSQTALSHFGEAEIDPAYGNFDRCDVLVQAGGGQIDVEDQFLNPSTPAPPLPGTVRRIGDVGVMRGTLADQECLRTVLLSDQNRIVVSADVLGDQPSNANLCTMAESATRTAVAVLNKSGVPRRASTPDPHSLATVDACKLLDANALTAVPGIAADQSEASFGDWECSWTSNTTNTTVALRFDRNSPLTAADGTPMQIGSRPAFLEPGDDGPDTCAVEIEHRTYTSPNEDQLSEIVRLTVAGPGLQSQLCGTATQLAGAVVAHLPAS
jgi:serine/threonine protein kinase